MVNVNKVLLGGNLTKDPVLSNLPGGTSVVDFRLATHRKYTDKDGQKREETCFVDCNAFGNNATNIHKYFAKGRPILVEGRLKLDTWVNDEGQKRNKIKIVAEKFHFVDPPKNNNSTEVTTGDTVASISIGPIQSDANRYKAQLNYVQIDTSGLTNGNGGRVGITRIRHHNITDSGFDNYDFTGQADMFIDNVSTNVDIDSVDIQQSGVTNYLWVSGVRYYTTGTEFSFSAIGMDIRVEISIVIEMMPI